MFSACRNPVLLPEVEVLMVPASLQGTRLPDLGPRRGPGGLGQSLDQDLNLGKSFLKAKELICLQTKAFLQN